tara:strand:+ start:916 stop:1101 length:186 start_codon:yes stop_codon:yes gene_type:complete
MLKDKLDELKEFLDDEKTKDAFVTAVNDAVNIPLINEKHEGKIIGYIYDLFAKTIITMIGD